MLILVSDANYVNFRVLISDEPQYIPNQNEFVDVQSHHPNSFAGIPKAHLTAAERKRLELASDSGCEYFFFFHKLFTGYRKIHKHPIYTFSPVLAGDFHRMINAITVWLIFSVLLE
jgi:hypothetical protein